MTDTQSTQVSADAGSAVQTMSTGSPRPSRLPVHHLIKQVAHRISVIFRTTSTRRASVGCNPGSRCCMTI
jgi:hypothetical protein